MKRVENKVALVTGATGGIGEAIARRLAENGAAVVLTDIDENGGRVAQAKLAAEGHGTLFVVHDVADEASWSAAVEAASGWRGKLDVVVNNAGVASDFRKTFEEIQQSEWHRVLRINLDGAFLGTKHGVLGM